MYSAITILMTIVCILLAMIVLVQNSKGGGLTAGFTSSNQIMGVRKTNDILEKLTWGFAIAMFILSVSATLMLPRNQEETGAASAVQEQIDNAALPSAGIPQAPAGGQGTAQPIGAQPAGSGQSNESSSQELTPQPAE